MRQSILIPLAVVSAIALVGAGAAEAQPSQGQISYEMTLEGLAGGKKHTTLVVENWSWGASAYDPSDFEGVDGAAAKPKKKDVSVQDFYFTVEQGPVSAQLLDALVAKKKMSKVTIRSKQTGTDKTFELVLKDVRVASYQTGGSGYGGSNDSISFAYKTAKLTVGASGGSQSADVTGNAP